MQNGNRAILITGGAGFIGSALVRRLVSQYPLIVLDLLTYAGDLKRLADLPTQSMEFIHGNICDEDLLPSLFARYQPYAVIHCAAESHVDRSIDGPMDFLKTNVEGTMNLLRCATRYWQTLKGVAREQFRFLHVSTDEVFGTLDSEALGFVESSPYRPNSPYAASKASADHFVRVWNQTYGLPTLNTHCSNNYGPWQFPEKLIPLIISKCLRGEQLPVYGDGSHTRDWIHVEDHVSAIETILKKAQPGSSWVIGANNELSNLQLVELICDIVQSIEPKQAGYSYRDQISFVQDRPGHDQRYAVNSQKLRSQLNWRPQVPFQKGLTNTISWYLHAQDWLQNIIQHGSYQGQPRLGVIASPQGSST